MGTSSWAFRVLSDLEPDIQPAIADMTRKLVEYLRVTVVALMYDIFPEVDCGGGYDPTTSSPRWTPIIGNRIFSDGEIKWMQALLRISHVCAFYRSKRLSGTMPERIEQAANILIDIQKNLGRPLTARGAKRRRLAR